ncbi:MAG: PQQ-binding-like beta-propeller repeat protein [Planctomycetaceae bacterium]|nr:PQQ-binding-like beta-propeller repeat protein [Planctomycetaceae bacterium]
MIRMFALILSAFLLCLPSYSRAAEPEWRGWRGPDQNGHASQPDLPITWDRSHVLWRTSLPGKGQSSPVIAGDRIFLTSALEDGRQRVVMAVDRKSGELLWSHVAWTGEPEPSHIMNGWASATCATDGERVFAFFGKGGGLLCYSVAGEKLWQQELGDFEGPWGTAAAPVIVGDLVIQNCDADSNAFLVAFDRSSGRQVWRTKREDARGWSTPIVIHVNGRDELVLNGDSGVRAYDPATGTELWYCKSFSGRGTPTVTPAGDLLHVVCGLRGDTYAVRPGGNGDVTATHMAWHTPRNTSRDLPSPIVLGEQSLVMDMRRATISSYDIRTGKEVWRQRVGDSAATGQFCATPVAWNNTAFFVAESGKTWAVRAGAEMEVVAVNDIAADDSEIFRSSITPSGNQLFLRSSTALYCIGQK